MNCLIIDGEKRGRTPLEKIVSTCEHLKLVASCASALEAADECRKHNIDVIFIDDHVIAKKDIRLLYNINSDKPRIIMISDGIENAKASLDSIATDIVLKPVTCARLMRVINRVLLTENNGKNTNEDPFIYVKVDRTMVKIITRNIHFIHAMSDYVRIHTPEKVYITYCTMKEMVKKLPEKDFLRVHRSFIVRIENISEFQEGFLSINQRLIPIGKLYKNELIERLNIV